MRRALLLLALAACGRLGFDPTGGGSGGDDMPPPPPPPGGAARIAAGDEMTCVVRTDGTAWCWGDGRDGRLGDGRGIDEATPAQVSGLANVVGIATGGGHACAFDRDGALFCWGRDDSGQLGHDGSSQATPVQVALTGKVVGVAAGLAHTCARTDAGDVFCWGSNSFGQLGVNDDSIDQQSTPTLVFQGATAIAAGGFHTCAVTSARGVSCWGRNDEGQLGTARSVPVPAPTAIPRFQADDIVASLAHTCARVGDRFSCWGRGFDGELGLGSFGEADAPGEVSSLHVIGLAVGFDHTCALDPSGDVYCFGANSDGGLGDGTVRGSTDPQLASTADGPFAGIAAGSHHTCALRENGSVACWGYGTSGQLGDGTLTRFTRVPVTGLPGGVTKVVAGDHHACAIAGVQLFCWGDNHQQQLGVGSTEPALAKASAVTFGPSEFVIDVAAGANHTCIVNSTNQVKCWGDNALGQLGDGTHTDRAMPTASLSPMLVSIAAGGDDTCGMTLFGTFACWGDDSNGELGDGGAPNTDSPKPVMVGSLVGSQVAVGGAHACAQGGSADVTCWGSSGDGQIGNGMFGPRFAPTAVSGVTNAMEVAAGRNHTCARNAAGSSSVQCWGANEEGQIGNGSRNDVTSPVSVTGAPSNPKLVAAGGQHSCAAANQGLFCWGKNRYGQLGDGGVAAQLTAEKVGAGNQVDGVALGEDFTCVLEGGVVSCSGDDARGQLGDGRTTRALKAVEVVFP